jgi:hypothetical protein
VAKRRKRPARRPAAADELQRREQETRDDLAAFVAQVSAVARESADRAGLDDAERKLRHHHADHFAHCVPELIAKLADHPHRHEREYWLFKLYQALSSVAFVAHRWTGRMEVGRATHAAATKKRTNTAKGDDVLVEAAGPIWRERPTLKPRQVAGHKRVKDQLPLKRDAVAKRLERLRPRIFSTD